MQLENDYSIVIHPLRSLLKFIYMEGERSVHLWKKLFQEVKLVVTDELIHLLPELKWFVKEEVHFKKKLAKIQNSSIPIRLYRFKNFINICYAEETSYMVCR